MSFDDWMLALHVLSAFAVVAGVVVFWVLTVAVRRADTPEDRRAEAQELRAAGQTGRMPSSSSSIARPGAFSFRRWDSAVVRRALLGILDMIWKPGA